MKKALILLILVIIVPFSYLISETVALDKVIDLNMSLKELSRSTPEILDSVITSDKYVIIEGAISSITEIERTDNAFTLDIHLINGEWIGLEKVEVYKCIVNVTGLDWEPRFPARTPRIVTDEHLIVNNQILVIGKVSDYVMDNSSLTAVVNAEYIRRIQ